jgi:hypothetical protein
MANTNKELNSGQLLTTTIADVYTVPLATVTILTGISVCNTSDKLATFTMYFVPSGQSESYQYARAVDIQVPPKGMWENISGKTLSTGAKIKMKSNIDNALSVHLSGVEIA